MGKWVNDIVLDTALNYVKNHANELIVCCGDEPATYDDLTSSGKMMARIVIDTASFAGPINGDVSGRQLIVNVQNDTVISQGTPTHIALCMAPIPPSTDGTILYVDTCEPAEPLEVNEPISINTWKIEIADPS